MLVEVQSSHLLELVLSPGDELKRAVCRLVFAHLGDKLCVVREEKLHIHRLRVLLVAQQSDEDLERPRKTERVLIFEDPVDLVDHLLGDLSRLLEHLGLLLVRLIASLLFLHQLRLLLFEQLFLLSDSIVLVLEFSGLLLLLLLPLLLLGLESVDLLDHLSLGGVGVVPVIGLQLGDFVHGLLAGIALVLNVGHQALPVH